VNLYLPGWRFVCRLPRSRQEAQSKSLKNLQKKLAEPEEIVRLIGKIYGKNEEPTSCHPERIEGSPDSSAYG
jgi:hypothetical protein